MQHFSHFRPRLVGSVLDGTADLTSRVNLHLFADSSEEVLLALLEKRISWDLRERSFRYAGGVCRVHPCFRFIAGDVSMELIVLPIQAYRNPPLSSVTERPERGVNAATLARLLASMPQEIS